jgi:branched-chain amino acid transport system permease protein
MLFSPEQQARAASLQIVAIGVMLCAILLVRPTGLFGERPKRVKPGKQAKPVTGESDS